MEETDTTPVRRISPLRIEDEMKTSFMDYAMSVIVSRALPDVRDGLKPVHRRILYGMNDLGMGPDRAYKKSARLVGDVLGKYHPHGDSAVYDAMVRMAQDFSLRYPLVDGQGNFGSLDGDSAAAMRYTEARMSHLGKEMLAEIEEDTCDFSPNFDASLKEPVVLPSKLPNLLVNGSSGIAVGMATNIPPHNVTEIIDGLIMLIEDEGVSIPDLMTVIKAPDFPTGGIIQGYQGVVDAYMTGRGKLRVRAKADIRETPSGREQIVVTEIPYMVNKATLAENMAKLARDKKILGISNITDASNREGIQLIIDVKRDHMGAVVLNQLFKHTNLETTFAINALALVDNKPEVLTLKDMLFHFLEHRITVVRRRTEYQKRKAEDRAHILRALVSALHSDNIEKVIEIIRGSSNAEEAMEGLCGFLRVRDRHSEDPDATKSIDEIQAKAILDMRLQKLASLETEAIIEELNELEETIARLNAILESRQTIKAVVKDEVMKMRQRFGDNRRTLIQYASSDISLADLVPKHEIMVKLTTTGYIKREPMDVYNVQGRGGKGKKGMVMKAEDDIREMFVTNSHNDILFFTTKGRVYWDKGYNIPEGTRVSKGKPIIQLLPNLLPDEDIMMCFPVAEYKEGNYLVFATKQGIIKRTDMTLYSRPRSTGVRAIVLKEDDEVIGVTMTDGSYQILLTTKGGYANRFDETEVRITGRVSRGVMGMTLRSEDDEVVSLAVSNDPEHDELLTITDKGFGKRSLVADYRKTRRKSKGVITIKVHREKEKRDYERGHVIAAKTIAGRNEMVITTLQGMVIRTRLSTIRTMGRNTMGVTLIKLSKKDTVVSMAAFFSEQEEEEGVEGEEVPCVDVGGVTADGTTPAPRSSEVVDGEDAPEADAVVPEDEKAEPTDASCEEEDGEDDDGEGRGLSQDLSFVGDPSAEMEFDAHRTLVYQHHAQFLFREEEKVRRREERDARIAAAEDGDLDEVAPDEDEADGRDEVEVPDMEADEGTEPDDEDVEDPEEDIEEI